MTEVKGAVIDPLRAAREDYDAVVKLTRELVRVPSRGGIDPYDPVLECMAAWLGEHGLASRRLAGPGGATAGADMRSTRRQGRPPVCAGCLPGHGPVRR